MALRNTETERGSSILEILGSGKHYIEREANRDAVLRYGLGLGFWVVFTIIVSLTLTLTLITSLTVILH